jgi:hypothetical protein
LPLRACAAIKHLYFSGDYVFAPRSHFITKVFVAAGLLFSTTASAQRPSLEASPPAAKSPPVAPNPNHVFTPDECRHVRTAISTMFGRVGPEKLSKEFRESVLALLMPDGQRSTCTGPRTIAWRTRMDAATFNTILSLLETSVSNVHLQSAGVELALSPLRPLFTNDECNILNQAYTAELRKNRDLRLTFGHKDWIDWMQEGCPREFLVNGNRDDQTFLERVQANILAHPDPQKRIDIRWRVFVLTP